MSTPWSEAYLLLPCLQALMHMHVGNSKYMVSNIHISTVSAMH